MSECSSSRWSLVWIGSFLGACASQSTTPPSDSDRFPDGACDYCAETIREDIPAFVGAEGFGAHAVGGRGGQIIYVTNLNESGPGSFREAVEAVGARTVVFDVAGVIDHREAPLVIRNPFITIAGQTAPGGGITLAGEEVRIATHDVVLRYVRVRTGDVDVPRDGWDNRDALNTGSRSADVSRVIIDHCSFSWAVDETVTLWFGTHDTTVQNSIFSEPLRYSHHPEGHHSMGLLLGAGTHRVSVHHNLFAHSNGRNPQSSGVDTFDFRNNLVYNPGQQAAQINGTGNRINFVSNLYLLGPNAADAGVPAEIIVKPEAVSDLELYIEGNVGPNAPTGSEDNWNMVVATDTTEALPSRARLRDPIEVPAVTTVAATELADAILPGVGASEPERGPVDARIVNDVRSGTGRIIDATSDVGGWPTIREGALVADRDRDGMPDAYEAALGLDPDDRADANRDSDGDGYTHLEEYLDHLTQL